MPSFTFSRICVTVLDWASKRVRKAGRKMLSDFGRSTFPVKMVFFTENNVKGVSCSLFTFAYL